MALVGAVRYLNAAYDVSLFRRLGARVTLETQPAGDTIPAMAVIQGGVVQAQAPFFDLFLDTFSDKALKVSIEVPRRFVPTMAETLSQMNFVIAGIAVLAGVLLWLVLRCQVFLPIRQITERIRNSSQDSGPSAGEVVRSLHDLASIRRDEVGAIAEEMASLNDRIVQLANRDALTGIATRRPFCERLEYALLRAERYTERVGILFIDLDEFKPINDTYGHPAGDQVLKVVAARIVSALRKADSVARLGGDEFAVLLEHPISPEDAVMVAAKVSDAIAAPMELGNVVVRVEASVGIAIFPDDGKDTDGLMAAADQAMYLNKTSRSRRRAGRRGS